MNKAFSMFLWENRPSVNTPLGQTLLNTINNALNIVDDRVVSLSTTKADQSDLLTALADVRYDESTGVFTFIKKNGSELTFDTTLEKLAINFSYDEENQRLVITLDDGTTRYVDMRALITELEFLNSDTVLFSVSSDGKVSASIAKGSITGDMLEPDYLANIQVEVAKAEKSASNAATSESNAKASETNAKASETNAKASETNAKASKTNALNSADKAAVSEKNAKTSETNAKNSETNSAASETKAKASETNAKTSETNAATSADESKENADLSKSYAVGTNNTVRENDNTDNSKYYSEVAKSLYSDTSQLLEEARKTLEETNQKITETTFTVNPDTGNLEYEAPAYNFTVTDDGNLHWEVI